MKTETAITKNRIIAELTKSPHGALKEYLVVGHAAASQEPEFYAHLIAWNAANGQIRDSKAALPIVSLACTSYPADFKDNSLAHLAMLSPRDLLRALQFGRDIKTTGNTRAIERMVEAYLRAREANWSWWERTAVQHRASLKELYARYHIKAEAKAWAILFNGERPAGTVFDVIARLGQMPPTEAAGHIIGRKIPFLVALGALGKAAKEPDLVLALIDRMSPTELVTNTKMLERLGVKTVPALRAAYEAALAKAATSKKTATLKTTRAAEAMGDDSLATKLRDVQEKQLKRTVDGNWVILADKSGSMEVAIESAIHVAAVLARTVSGNVTLILFDTAPRAINATGKTLEQLKADTKYVEAKGGTSIGCGIQYVLDSALDCDGIALVSDGCENAMPLFATTYQRLAKREDRAIPMYWYQVKGDLRTMIARHKGGVLATNWELAQVEANQRMEAEQFKARCQSAEVDLQTFDLTGGVDYYSLPNLVKTMRANRYSLVEEILATPLKTLEEVLSGKRTALPVGA